MIIGFVESGVGVFPMDEAQEILLKFLERSGISIPLGVSKIQDLSDENLYSICSQSLHLIDGSISFPSLLPDLMVDRFKICTEIASLIKKLGYVEDLSFRQLLYPSEESSYKLVRFLAERLSRASEVERDNEPFQTVQTSVRDRTEKNNRQTVPRDHVNSSTITSSNVISEDANVETARNTKTGWKQFGSFHSISPTTERSESILIKEAEECRRATRETVNVREKLDEVSDEVKNLKKQETILKNDVSARVHETRHLGVDSYDQYPVDFYFEELNMQIEEKIVNIVEMELRRDVFEEQLRETPPTPTRQLNEQNSVERFKLEIQAIKEEILRREKERIKLSIEFENQPKVAASRQSYIQRITEITKNSSKLDADLERIVLDTRDLQMLSNSIQDNLYRTYAIVADSVFRNARKDAVGRQVYQLLTSIHTSFEQISEKILAVDRIRREVADLETKVTALGSHNIDIIKLQQDHESIRKENEILEQKLRHELNSQ